MSQKCETLNYSTFCRKNVFHAKKEKFAWRAGLAVYAALDPLHNLKERNENSIKGQPLEVLWPSDPV